MQSRSLVGFDVSTSCISRAPQHSIEAKLETTDKYCCPDKELSSGLRLAESMQMPPSFSLPTAHQLCNSTQHRCAVASTGVKQCAKGSPREPLAAALWRRMAAMPCKGGKFAQAVLCSAMSLVDKDQWPRFPDGSPKLLLAISWRPCWTCRCVAAHRCTDQCSIQ